MTQTLASSLDYLFAIMVFTFLMSEVDIFLEEIFYWSSGACELISVDYSLWAHRLHTCNLRSPPALHWEIHLLAFLRG